MQKIRIATPIVAVLVMSATAGAQSVWRLPDSIDSPRGEAAYPYLAPWLSSDGSSFVGNALEFGDIAPGGDPGYRYVYRMNEAQTTFLYEERIFGWIFSNGTGELVSVSDDGRTALLRYEDPADPDDNYQHAYPVGSIVFQDGMGARRIDEITGGFVESAELISGDGSTVVSATETAVARWEIPEPGALPTISVLLSGDEPRVLYANSYASVIAGRSYNDAFVHTEEHGVTRLYSPDSNRQQLWPKHVSDDGSRMLINRVPINSLDYFHRIPSSEQLGEWDPTEARALMWSRDEGEMTPVGFEGAEWSFFGVISDNGAFVFGASDRPNATEPFPDKYFMWTQETGLVPMIEGLESLGYDFGSQAWIEVVDISDDGNTLLYTAIETDGNRYFFLARVPAPGAGGLVALVMLTLPRRHR